MEDVAHLFRVDGHRSSALLVEAGDNAKQRALTATGRAHDRDEFAPVDEQIDPLERDRAARKDAGNVGQRQGRRGRRHDYDDSRRNAPGDRAGINDPRSGPTDAGSHGCPVHRMLDDPNQCLLG